MMKKWLAWLVLGLYLAMGTVAWAQPQIPPKPATSIYVQDYAGVLADNTKAGINDLGTQLASKTKAQVVVVTVKTLGGATVEEYALALLRQWGIGDKTLNNGVLLLVAVDDRQSRIEVGYGLEGALPDAKTGRIQDEYMLPYFKRADYNQGIFNTYLALTGEVAKEYKQELTTESQPAPPAPDVSTESWWDGLPWWAQIMIIGGLLLLLIIDWVFFGGSITWFIILMLRRGGGGGGGGFGGGSGGGGGSSRRW